MIFSSTLPASQGVEAGSVLGYIPESASYTALGHYRIIQTGPSVPEAPWFAVFLLGFSKCFPNDSDFLVTSNISTLAYFHDCLFWVWQWKNSKNLNAMCGVIFIGPTYPWSDLCIRVSQTEWPCADLTDVTLADEYSKSILAAHPPIV